MNNSIADEVCKNKNPHCPILYYTGKKLIISIARMISKWQLGGYWVKKEGLAPRIKRNYIKIYIFSILLLLIPVAVIQYGTKLISAYDGKAEYKSAQTLIKDDYNDIDIKTIKKSDGMAQVVTKDLKTIVLCGKSIFADGKISEKEWVSYLIDTASKKKDDNDKYYSMAYSEKGKYWLIVSYKNNAFLTITINNNTYKGNSINGAIGIASIIIVAVAAYILSIFLIIYLFSYKTTTQLVKQIQSLKDYTIMLQNGEYTKRLSTPMDSEILELKEAFNELAYSLDKEKNEKQRSEDSKKRLLMDISHDLNNPIATIKSSSEILLTKDEMESTLRKKYCEIIYNNSIRANELLKNLFNYIKIDGPDFILRKENIDLCEFIRLELIRFQSEFEAAHINLESDIPEKEIYISMDAIQMENVIYNLLTNAIKYNKAGTNVLVKIEENNNIIKLYIKDNGIGIDVKIADTIFEPFTRADESRNSKSGGSGLGLAIVKKIINAHGFSIELITDINKGCNFVISIPVKVV